MGIVSAPISDDFCFDNFWLFEMGTGSTTFFSIEMLVFILIRRRTIALHYCHFKSLLLRLSKLWHRVILVGAGDLVVWKRLTIVLFYHDRAFVITGSLWLTHDIV